MGILEASDAPQALRGGLLPSPRSASLSSAAARCRRDVGASAPGLRRHRGGRLQDNRVGRFLHWSAPASPLLQRLLVQLMRLMLWLRVLLQLRMRLRLEMPRRQWLGLLKLRVQLRLWQQLWVQLRLWQLCGRELLHKLSLRPPRLIL